MELIALIGEREERLRVRRRGDVYEVTLGEHTYRVDARITYESRGTELLSLRLDGRQDEVAVRRERAAEGRYQVSTATGSTTVELADPLTHLARLSHAKGAQGAHQVTAYMPGKVVMLLVEEGQKVEAGQGVLVLEAMKMENEIQTESDGVVGRIFVEPGQAVEGGDPLFEIEEGPAGPPGEEVP